MKRRILTLLLITFTVLFYTHGAFGNFFQQDEWGGFGKIIALSQRPFWEWLVVPGKVHFAPLGHLTWFFLYKLFGFQAQYYVFMQLSLHIATSFLVYVFVNKLTRSWGVGILAALFFATNTHANQAFIHLATFPTIIVTLFIVLFFAYSTYARDYKYFSRKDLLISLVIFFASVFFKEDGLIIPPLFLIYLFLFDRQKFNKKNLWFFLTFFGAIVFFGLFRLLSQFANPSALVGSGSNFLHAYIYNAFTLPVKFIVQNIVEGGNLFLFLWKHNGFIYENDAVNFLNSYPLFMDFIFLIILNLLVVAIIYLKHNFIKIKEIKKYIYFAISLIILDALLVSAVGRQMYILESRYLYLSGIAVFMILSFILVKTYQSKIENSILEFIKKTAILIIMLVILVTSYVGIQSTIKEIVFYGNARKEILKSLLVLHPTIPKDTIFYVKCKTECYRNGEFNVSDKFVLPFTLGSGWVILTQYAQGNEDVYARFFSEKVGDNRPFLGDIGSQGYKKFGDYGFGYFYDINFLKQVIEKQNLSTEIVIGLEYNEENFTINDITPEIRDELNKK